MSDEPLLFLDVDGVLNPDPVSSGRRPEGYVTHRTRPSGWTNPHQKPLRIWLNPAHGPKLLDLPVHLIWATAWEHEANEWIGPHLGLPKLPVVEFGDRSRPDARVHWKTDKLIRYAAERPFAWLDDEISRYDERRVVNYHPGAALLLQVTALIGLTENHLHQVGTWCDEINENELGSGGDRRG